MSYLQRKQSPFWLGPCINGKMGDDFMHGLSSDNESQPRHLSSPQRSQRRPARDTLPFVPYEDWIPDQLYNDQPPSCMRYVMDWKLTLNRITAAKQTEDDLGLAPSDFWNEELSPKIADIVTSTGKPCEAEATTIVISVNDRSEHDITKRFDKLQIDWPVVERQLQAWSHFLRIGKRLRINATFNYVDGGKAACTAGRGATATQLAERNTRVDAEEVTSGRPDAWRQVYQLLRCPGAPCDRGPYCWQDSDGKKHYKLMGHHLRSLVKFVQRGGKLDTHDDVPQDVRTTLYAEEQQHSDRKRKRRDSGSYPTGHYPMIINNYIPAYPGEVVTGSDMSAPDLATGLSLRSSLTTLGLRDDAVKAYREWHCSKVRSRDQKQQYEVACDLTMDRGFDLELLHEDNDAEFYIEQGVLEGVARRWVRDVKAFLDEYDAL